MNSAYFIPVNQFIVIVQHYAIVKFLLHLIEKKSRSLHIPLGFPKMENFQACLKHLLQAQDFVRFLRFSGKQDQFHSISFSGSKYTSPPFSWNSRDFASMPFCRASSASMPC